MRSVREFRDHRPGVLMETEAWVWTEAQESGDKGADSRGAENTGGQDQPTGLRACQGEKS